ncbi:MAG: hypothetical protein DWQ31_15140 [Planctomycetota bacterium]|nr:MAG: hypothetical protein DWQ31_15140 [Planctomycetota bacterium]
MKQETTKRNKLGGTSFAALALATLALTGCQVNVGGQTLPSPYYLSDDIQFFPSGSEFPLEREAAAIQQARQNAAELEALQQ